MCDKCRMTAAEFDQDTKRMTVRLEVDVAKLLQDTSLSQDQRVEVLIALTPYIVNLIDGTVERTGDAIKEMVRHISDDPGHN